MNTKNELPLPTNRTVAGPVIFNSGDHFTVKYDYERDDGTVVWAQVDFKEVLACEYRQLACCRDIDVIEPNEVRVLRQSSYLSDTISRYEASFGYQEWQKQKGGGARFVHYTIFFDDAGCINVIASEISTTLSESY